MLNSNTLQDSFKIKEREIVAPATKRFVVENNLCNLITPKDRSELFRGKVEINIPETKILRYKIRSITFDKELISFVGGEKGVEINLAHIYYIINQQKTSKDGFLFYEFAGYPTYNSFFARDKTGTLCVCDITLGNDWFIIARPVNKKMILKNNRVFLPQP